MKETSLRKRSGIVLFAKLSARLTRRLEPLSLNDLKGAALKELKAKMMEDSRAVGANTGSVQKEWAGKTVANLAAAFSFWFACVCHVVHCYGWLSSADPNLLLHAALIREASATSVGPLAPRSASRGGCWATGEWVVSASGRPHMRTRHPEGSEPHVL